ncbi:MAG: hypothetical protein ACOVO1_02930 [Chitinophagaceae bacterium]
MKKIIIILLAITTRFLAQSQSNNDTIPIRLSSFNGTSLTYNSVKLNWKVVCNLDFAYFQVQRSTDGINYTTINTFQSDRLRCKQPFDYEDQNIGGRIYYRVSVGDKDGKFSSSKTVGLTGKTKPFDIVSLIPTIVASNSQLNISSASIDKIQVVIKNAQGITVKEIYTKLSTGINYINLELSNLAKGFYSISVINSNSNTITTRFIKQ